MHIAKTTSVRGKKRRTLKVTTTNAHVRALHNFSPIIERNLPDRIKSSIAQVIPAEQVSTVMNAKDVLVLDKIGFGNV